MEIRHSNVKSNLSDFWIEIRYCLEVRSYTSVKAIYGFLGMKFSMKSCTICFSPAAITFIIIIIILDFYDFVKL